MKIENFETKRDITLKPTNPIASFIDDYGEQKIIHKRNGNKLAVFRGNQTPVLKMNSAANVLIGEKIKKKRIEKKMSLKQLCIKAGLQNVNPKQYMHSIEAATRLRGCGTGTLYAIAFALECQLFELMPTVDEVLEYAGINKEEIKMLSVA